MQEDLYDSHLVESQDWSDLPDIEQYLAPELGVEQSLTPDKSNDFWSAPTGICEAYNGIDQLSLDPRFLHTFNDDSWSAVTSAPTSTFDAYDLMSTCNDATSNGPSIPTIIDDGDDANAPQSVQGLSEFKFLSLSFQNELHINVPADESCSTPKESSPKSSNSSPVTILGQIDAYQVQDDINNFRFY